MSKYSYMNLNQKMIKIMEEDPCPYPETLQRGRGLRFRKAG